LKEKDLAILDYKEACRSKS